MGMRVTQQHRWEGVSASFLFSLFAPHFWWRWEMFSIFEGEGRTGGGRGNQLPGGHLLGAFVIFSSPLLLSLQRHYTAAYKVPWY
jgi:hypothetical protein